MRQTSTTLGALRSTEVPSIAIASDVLTITSVYTIAQAESSTSDLATITPSLEGIVSTDSYFVMIEADAGDTITLKHGTGNMVFKGATDIVLTGGQRALLFGSAALGFTDFATSASGGGSLQPFDDDTPILQDSADNTKQLIINVGGITTSTTRTLTYPDSDVTLPVNPIGGSTGATDNALLRANGTGGSTAQSSAVSIDDSGVMTDASIDADNNTITNIGSTEVKAELITGLTADASPDGAADYVMTYDNSGTALKKVLLNNLPAGSGGLYTSDAILYDQKTSGTDGGSSSAATWNARNLNTEHYDPDSIVSISSNQFTPISGDFEIEVTAISSQTGDNRLRLYNVTDTSAVQSGQNSQANGATVISSFATLKCKFTADGTDAYRIDHYTDNASATDGLGRAVGDGSPEIYMTIVLRKLA